MSKLYFLAGLGAGYVLGAKAGRDQYRKIADAAKSTWEKPAVQRFVHRVDGVVDAKAPLLHSVAETVLAPSVGSDPGAANEGESDDVAHTADGTPYSVGSADTTGAEGDQYRG